MPPWKPSITSRCCACAASTSRRTSRPGAENRIDPEQLNAIDRRILKESLRQAGVLQERLKLDYAL